MSCHLYIMPSETNVFQKITEPVGNGAENASVVLRSDLDKVFRVHIKVVDL